MTAYTLVLRYTAFAVIATVLNLAAQRVSLALYGGDFSLALAILVGTGVGLVVKYLLDKRWIFGDFSSGLAVHTKKFTVYTLMGVFTTLIFWGSEAAAWMIWQTDFMRELGAVVGLAVGYVIKCQLDKRFVFEPTGRIGGGSHEAVRLGQVPGS